MARLAFALLMVVAVAYVVADEDESCEGTKDCACGSVCNDGTCAEGCMVFDTFMAAGSEAEVYGRKCKCGTSADDRGMPLECAENVEFTGAPADIAEWENNPACAA